MLSLEELYEAVIFVDETATREDFEATVESIFQQRPAPVRVIASTLTTTKLGMWDIRDVLRGYPAYFKVDICIDPEFKIGDAIDLSINSVTAGFVLIAKAGHKFDVNFVSRIYGKLLDKKIVAIDYEDEDNFFIVKSMYQIEKYNLPSDIVKKYPEYSIK